MNHEHSLGCPNKAHCRRRFRRGRSGHSLAHLLHLVEPCRHHHSRSHPVTNAGRLVGIIVLFIGVGLLGVLTGFPAHAYFSPGTGEVSAAMVPVYPNRQIDEFRRLLNEQAKASRELPSQLGAIKVLLETFAVDIESTNQRTDKQKFCSLPCEFVFRL